MKTIAFSGMPGSGKSETAGAINGDNGFVQGPNVLVDGYADRLAEQWDYNPGFHAGYVYNLNVALERANVERQFENAAGYHYLITCGTLLETSVYAAMDFEAASHFDDDAERQDEMKRIEAIMKTLACMYMDTFHYDYVFYCPPVKPAEDERWGMFDRNLQVAFQAFYLVPIIPLPIEIDARLPIIERIVTGEESVESFLERNRIESETVDGSGVHGS